MRGRQTRVGGLRRWPNFPHGCLFILPLFGFAVLLVISGIALFSTLSGTRDITQLPSVLIGKPPPQTELALLSEASEFLDFSAFSGEVIASISLPAGVRPAGLRPALEQLSKTLPIIGIAYKDKPDDTTSFLQQYGNPFRQIGMDADGHRAGLGLYGVPETYLIDRSGKIMLRHAGPVDKSVMEQLILPAIAGAR